MQNIQNAAADPTGWHGTTILCVRRDGHVTMAGDGSKKTTEGLKFCADCHRGQKEKGFVFANYLRRLDPKNHG